MRKLILVGIIIFCQVGFSKYYIELKNKVVYKDGILNIKVKNVDINTFKELDEFIGVDKNSIYYKGEKIENIRNNEFDRIKYIMKSGNDIRLMYELVEIFEDSRKYDLAERYLKILLDKEETAALYGLAIIYRAQEKYDLAEKYNLLAVDNDDVDAMIDLTILYEDQGKYDLAKKYYLKALDYELRNSVEIPRFIDYYEEQGKYEIVKKYKKLKASYIIDLIILYEDQKEYEIAELYFIYELAYDLRNEAKVEVTRLIDHYVNQGKYEIAEKYKKLWDGN